MNRKDIFRKSKKIQIKDCLCLNQQDMKTCNQLEMTCFRLKNKNDLEQRRCAFSELYERLTTPSDKPETEEIKEIVLKNAMKEWSKNPSSGGRNKTATALEDAICEKIKKIIGSCSKRKSIELCRNNKIIADCLIENKNINTIISVKTSLTKDSIRETFGYAYILKQSNLKRWKIFMFTPVLVCNRDKALIEAFKPYLDGIYSLSGPLYFDDLLEKLRSIYDL